MIVKPRTVAPTIDFRKSHALDRGPCSFVTLTAGPVSPLLVDSNYLQLGNNLSVKVDHGKIIVIDKVIADVILIGAVKRNDMHAWTNG